jgi:hypothetical protein
MRKLLLGTTALAAAATLSANVAVADVSISGYYEWTYMSKSSDITANDGTTFGSDSEIKFSFSNKTDSGLTIGMATELYSDGGDTAIDESSFSISGGFGKIVLGNNDGASTDYEVVSTALPAEEIYAGIGTSNDLVLTNAAINNLAGDDNKISYHLPAMGAALDDIPVLAITEFEATELKHGRAIVNKLAGSVEYPDWILAMLDNKAVAICSTSEGYHKPKRVFNL